MSKENLHKAFLHTKLAQDYFAETWSATKDEKAKRKIKGFYKSAKFIVTDFTESGLLPKEVMDTFKELVVKGDPLFHEAIAEKLLRLSPKNKAIIEATVDYMLNGGEIEVEEKE